jgi:WD40 repeat protein
VSTTRSLHGTITPPAAGEFKQQTKSIGPIKGMSFSSDGRLLALGGEDGSIEVWEWPLMRRRLRCACWLAGRAGQGWGG